MANLDVDKDRERLTFNAFLPIVLGASLAAIIGGLVWGYLVILTGYELGFVAWALGGLSGGGIVLLSRGKSGTPWQVMSVLASMLGITIGKYIFFYDTVTKRFKAAYGADSANDVSIFSLDLIRVFIENPATTLGGLNILWVLLAVLTAWLIPKSTPFKITTLLPWWRTRN